MKIKFTGRMNDNHSLSTINRYICTELRKYKYGDNKVVVIEDDTEEYDIEIRHTYPPVWSKTKAKVLLYIQEWEFERCPLEWVINWNSMAQRLIVPSEYLKNIYEEAGVRIPITVIPNGYNPRLMISKEKPKVKPYKFLYIGSYQYRKGYDILYEIWDNYLGKVEDIELYVKDMNHVYGKKDGKSIKRMNATNVKYIDEELTEKEMAELYKRCDCVIVCSRGESYCMPVLEGLVNGLDIICPNIGPYKEIIKDDTCYVRCRKVVVDPIEKFIGKRGDSFTNMGSHFQVYEVLKEDLLKRIIEKKEKHRSTEEMKQVRKVCYTWREVGKKYFDIVKYEFSKNI